MAQIVKADMGHIQTSQKFPEAVGNPVSHLGCSVGLANYKIEKSPLLLSGLFVGLRAGKLALKEWPGHIGVIYLIILFCGQIVCGNADVIA